MKAQREPIQEKNAPVSQEKGQSNPAGEQVAFEDNRPAVPLQRKLRASMASPPSDEETTQLRSSMEAGSSVGSALMGASSPNGPAGIPSPLRTGIEQLSGLAMDDVKVHYNSPKPAELDAHAFAQGTEIHLAPGQEKQLPHEAWHVVQQKQNRVKPTRQLKSKIPLNEDTGLEREADVMGAKAMQASSDASVGAPPLKTASVNEGSVQRKLKVVDSKGKRMDGIEDRWIPDQLYIAFLQEQEVIVENCLDIEEKNVFLKVTQKNFYNEDNFKGAVKRLLESPINFGDIFLRSEGRERSFKSQLVALGHIIRKEIARDRVANSTKFEDLRPKGLIPSAKRLYHRTKNPDKREQYDKANYLLTKLQLQDDLDRELEHLKKEEEKNSAYQEKVKKAIQEEYEEEQDPKVYKTALLGAGSAVAYYIKSQPLDPEETLLIGTAQPWGGERGGEGNINHPPHQLMIQEELEENTKYESSQGSLTKRKDFSKYIAEVIEPFEPKEILITNITKKQAEDDFYYEIEAGNSKYFAQNVVYGIGAGKHRPPGFLDNPDGGKFGLGDAQVFFTTDEGWPFKRVMDMDLFQNFLIQNEAKKKKGKIDISELEVVVIGPNAAIDVVTACIREGVKKVIWMAGKTPLFLEGTDNLIAKREYDLALKGKSSILEIGVDRANIVDPRGRKPAAIDVKHKRHEADLVVYGIGQDGGPINRLLPENVDFELMYDRNLHFNEETEDSLAFVPQESGGGKKSLSSGETKSLMKLLGKEDLMMMYDKQPLDGLGGFDMEKAKLLPTVTGLQAEKASAEDTTSFEIIGATANSILRTRNISNQYSFIDDVVEGLDEGRLSPLVGEFKEEFEKIRGGIQELNRLKASLRRARDRNAVKGQITAQSVKLNQIFNPGLTGILTQMRVLADDQQRVRINWLESMLAEIQANLDFATGGADMAKVAKTLPANVLTQDQLHTIMALEMAKGERALFRDLEAIDLVADDRTQIVKFISHTAPYLPAPVINLIAQKIQIDRRNRPTDSAPLPEMIDATSFHLKKKEAFESHWHELIERMNAKAKEMVENRE